MVFLLTIPGLIERKNMHTDEVGGAEDLRAVLQPILDRNSRKWLRFIMGILGSEADAEDVMQEAVRRVLVRGQPLPSPEHVRMYLGRAIVNAALEFYNHRKRERMRQIPIWDNIPAPDQTVSPYDFMAQKEQSDQTQRLLALLRSGLARLPQKQHEALRLTILESRGLSIRDIGMTHGIPYSTLRHRSKQGLRQLRRYLERSLAKKQT
jgi:RNA polymerase sigma factor (sigma-70 family)